MCGFFALYRPFFGRCGCAKRFLLRNANMRKKDFNAQHEYAQKGFYCAARICIKRGLLRSTNMHKKDFIAQRRIYMQKRGDIMSIRQQIEEFEQQHLSPFAMLSSRTQGRQKPIEPCDLRTEFQRDRDRIIHSKSFRRLKHKTQVFLSPNGDHYRTRLTHTLEVSQVARTIARSLRLNEDLTEAIALGHDLGHTPFGHAGERVLNSVMDGGFTHNRQSLRVVDILEPDI